MQIAVFADIHGNLPALEAVLEDCERFNPDQLIVAGDYIGGPQPNQVLQLLQDRNALMISGNSDTNLIRLIDGEAPPGWYRSQQFALLRWSGRNISPDQLDFLRSLPRTRSLHFPGADPIRLVHGSPRDQYESIFPYRAPATLEAALAETSEPVLVCGHTHTPWTVERGGRLALNPGAVCGPLNGEIGAQYALLRWGSGPWRSELRSVPYDLELIRTAFRDSGLLQEGGALARAFLRSIETGSDVAKWFLDHAYQLAAAAGAGEVDVVPDPFWKQAEDSFDWDAVGSDLAS